jgi:hypothetical protein
VDVGLQAAEELVLTLLADDGWRSAPACGLLRLLHQQLQIPEEQISMGREADRRVDDRDYFLVMECVCLGA